MNQEYDVIIVGGSFAGLSSALQLVRARKNVLVIDYQKPRNRKPHESHGFLTQDGTHPLEILNIAREQLFKYPTFKLINEQVISAQKNEYFEAVTSTKTFKAKRMILATGVRDILPEIKGLKEIWGLTAFFCPYCHAYELSDKYFSLITDHEMAIHQAILLKEWTDKLTLFTKMNLTPEQLKIIKEKNITVIKEEINEIISNNGHVENIKLNNGDLIKTDAVVLTPDFSNPLFISPLVKMLNCQLNEQGFVKVNEKMETSIQGLYSAGDTVSMMASISIAVSQGSIAGAMSHQSLIFN